MADGETGYDTLVGAGLVPEVPSEIVNDWEHLNSILDTLIRIEQMPYKTIVMDAAGGFEKMLHKHVCKKFYSGKWGDDGFGAFQKGYEVSLPTWIEMLSKLDSIRRKGVMILLLGHTKIEKYKNPEGMDFDRFAGDLHKSTYGITSKWADAVLFGKFITITEEQKGKKGVAKGIGGDSRIIYTERRDAYDAKNRYSMPSEIEITTDKGHPEVAWQEIWKHIVRK
jgi:hypothetical protein